MAETFKIAIDTKPLVDALERLGPRAQGHLLAVAFHTATAIKAEAMTRIAKGRPFTVNQIIFETRRRADGYVVTVNRSVKDNAGLTGSTRSGRARKTKVRHVGKWLEFGTLRMRAKPWLFPAAATQEQAYLDRIREAVDRAIAEAGV